MSELDADPLALDRETMRELGYRTIDMLVERLTDPSAPPLRRGSPAAMRARLSGPPPRAPERFEDILRQLDTDVLPFASRGDHPGFFAFTPFSGTWPGALGDLIASACNVYAGSWMESAGPSQVELEVLGWFKEWIGYPESAAGALVTGGSAANLAALACAREALADAMSPNLVAYVSDQAHSSVARAARLLGFGPGQVRVLPTDSEYRLRLDALAASIRADRRAGRQPLAVCATAGTTNTGAIDPLPEVAALCRDHRVWLHVDAAYGGFAVLCDRGRRALEGIGEADSVTLDPHKWLHQPYECGCLLVRDGGALQRAFELTPDYLTDARAAADEVNFCDRGLQLTRAARAFKLWVSLRAFGLEAFRHAIERSLELADEARRRIAASEVLELTAPPSLGIVCFRRRFPGVEDEREVARLNGALAAALEHSGIGLVSSTRLRGRHTLRMCILSHTSGPEHLGAVLDFLEHEEPAAAPSRTDAYERDPSVRDALHVPPRLRPVPLFASLAPEEALLVETLAVEREVDAGETLVQQWDAARDFFVIAEGSADVLVDGEAVARLGPGDFFGELAALDWSAGYGYPRLASVVATSASRLLVFPDGSLNELLRAVPALEPPIREAVRDRLSRRS